MRGSLRLFLVLVMMWAATSAEARRTYTIQQGDTPSGLPTKFAPSLEDLRAANPKINFSLLHVGDEIIDPRPEFSDIQKAEREIVELKTKLASVTTERDTRMSELATSRLRADDLQFAVEELLPLANQAKTYRDRFWSWVGGFGAGLGLAIMVIGWQIYSRGKLNDTVSRFQCENAQYRSKLTKAGVVLDIVEPELPRRFQTRSATTPSGGSKMQSIIPN